MEKEKSASRARIPRKPLDIRMDIPKDMHSRHGPGLAIAMFIILLAVIGLALFVANKPASSVPEGTITLYLQGNQPFLAGGQTSVQAFSSCGKFVLLLDGKQISSGDTSVDAQVPLAQGTHMLEAENGACSNEVNFTVVAPECQGDANRSCMVGNCPGTQACSGGFYSGCQAPPRVCEPGETIGCSIDGCHFGYATCNGCGSGFGQCLPASSGTSEGNCSGSTCG